MQICLMMMFISSEATWKAAGSLGNFYSCVFTLRSRVTMTWICNNVN